jgi:hypothetical protein
MNITPISAKCLNIPSVYRRIDLVVSQFRNYCNDEKINQTYIDWNGFNHWLLQISRKNPYFKGFSSKDNRLVNINSDDFFPTFLESYEVEFITNKNIYKQVENLMNEKIMEIL